MCGGTNLADRLGSHLGASLDALLVLTKLAQSAVSLHLPCLGSAFCAFQNSQGDKKKRKEWEKKVEVKKSRKICKDAGGRGSNKTKRTKEK